MLGVHVHARKIMKEIQERLKILIQSAIIEIIENNSEKIVSYKKKSPTEVFISVSGLAVDVFPGQHGGISISLIPAGVSETEVAECADLDLYFDGSKSLPACKSLSTYVSSLVEGDLSCDEESWYKEISNIIFIATAMAAMSSKVVESLCSVNIQAYTPSGSEYTRFFKFYVFDRESNSKLRNYCEAVLLNRYVLS